MSSTSERLPRPPVPAGTLRVGRFVERTVAEGPGERTAIWIQRDRPWVGSANQEFVPLSDRFPDLPAAASSAPDRLEVTVAAHGVLSVNGWADDETLDALLRDLGRPTR